MSNTGCCPRQCTGKNASRYLQNGFHCAEAVALAVLEGLDVDPDQAVAHATPFGGGMGRTFCETCGALTGGLIAIGHLHGRTEQGESWDTPAAMGQALRDSFVKSYGETGCGILRDRFGEEQSEQCARLVEVVARATERILSDRQSDL